MNKFILFMSQFKKVRLSVKTWEREREREIDGGLGREKRNREKERRQSLREILEPLMY